MQVIPIATRETITIPADSYLVLHAENVTWGTPKHIADSFMALNTNIGDEYPGVTLYTPDGVNIEDADTREPYGTIQTVKESNGNHLVHFRTLDGKHDTVLSRTIILDSTNLEEAEVQHRTVFRESVADKRLKPWKNVKYHLIKAGYPAELVEPVEEILRDGILNDIPREAYARAVVAITDVDAVNTALARLGDELSAGKEAVKTLNYSTESGSDHE